MSRKRLSEFGEVNTLTKPREPKTPPLPFAVRLTKSFLESIKKVSTQYDVVVSTGSNFCIPPATIAWIKGIPIVNIEDLGRFVKPSKTALLLQPFSTLTVLQWEEQRAFLKGVVMGPLLPKPKLRPWNGGYILVTGGTYGHKLLFDTVAETNLLNIVLQTGRVNPITYMERHPEWKVFTLTDKFHEILAGAELVVTHFGSSTLLESVVYQKPIVLVPNPEWTRTTGIEDAKHVAGKLNAVLVSDIDPKNLVDAINEARKRKAPKLPNGSEKLSELIMKL